MEHQVGVGDVVIAASEATSLEVVGRARPAAQEQPARTDERTVTPLERRRDRDGLRAGVLHVYLEVILQVLADTAQVVRDLDTGDLQHGLAPDAGQLQQLRAVDRAAGQDDLTSAGS